MFRTINRLFGIPLEVGVFFSRNSFGGDYMLLIKINYFNVLIDNKPFSINL